MAGGKETPRQKMIGMMYLVLTALLALNVSSAVLEKFAIINETLGSLNTDNTRANENLLRSVLGSTVSSAEVDAAKDAANKVRDLTKTVVTYMEEVKKQMSSEKSGEPIPKEELPQNTNRAEELMLSERGKRLTLAAEYQNTLDKYVDDLNGIVKLEQPYGKITKTAGQYEVFSDASPDLKKKPFDVFAFQGTPTMGAIAFVSQQQSEILEYEKAALTYLLNVTKGTVYEVDQLVPMVQADANTLVAGQTYNGQLFVAGAASGVDPEMFMNDRVVQVEEVDIGNGVKIKMGKISFKASATKYDAKSGIADMSYNVKINLPGYDEPLQQAIQYKVVRPKATFSSVASSTLYMQCGNIKDVSIQGLTEVSGLALRCPADQGKIMKTGSGKFALIPKRPQMNVTITMDGVNIGTERFYAKQVPEPQAVLKIGNQAGKEVNKEKGIPRGTTRVIYALRIPDETFVKENRKDAGYRISRMVVFTPNGPKPLSNNVINLSQLGLRPGQTFTISQVQVVRSTYDPAVADNLPVNCKLGDTFFLATK